jgi:hypothetical protein
MWRERRELGAWCEERRGYEVVLIAALASTVMEMNQAPPWARYLKDQRDTGEDWGASGARCGAVAPPEAPPSLNFGLGSHASVYTLMMLVSDFYLAGSQRDRAKMYLIMLNQNIFKFHMIL